MWQPLQGPDDFRRTGLGFEPVPAFVVAPPGKAELKARSRTYRSVRPLLARMFARPTFHVHVHAEDDVEEVLHHGHLLEHLLVEFLKQNRNLAQLLAVFRFLRQFLCGKFTKRSLDTREMNRVPLESSCCSKSFNEFKEVV